MNFKMYLVYDCKGDNFGMPLLYENRADACRAFHECVNEQGEKRSKIALYPGDFTLFEIGDYDKPTGSIRLYDVRLNLGVGTEFLNVVRGFDRKEEVLNA